MNNKQINGNIKIGIDNILIGLFFFIISLLYVIKTKFGIYTPHVISLFIIGLSILFKGYIILSESIKLKKGNKDINKHFSLIIKVCNYMVYLGILLFLLMMIICKK